MPADRFRNQDGDIRQLDRTKRLNFTADSAHVSPRHGPHSYWTESQTPMASLWIVAPAVVVYEWAVIGVGGGGTAIPRSGADAWLRRALASFGVGNEFVLPVVLLGILLCWHLIGRYRTRISIRLTAAMLLESTAWAIVLVGSSRLVDAGFGYLDRAGTIDISLSAGKSGHAFSPLISFLGAGIYEEFLFRLALIPCFYTILRALLMPQVLSSSFAVTASSVLFAAAHHLGTPTENFTWFAFIFRWMAGVIFAWIFILRGFGITVATHVIYDILVGWFGWQF